MMHSPQNVKKKSNTFTDELWEICVFSISVSDIPSVTARKYVYAF